MKRYILSVVLMLAMLSSCKVEDGDNCQPIDIGLTIASHTMQLYEANVVRCMNYALIADWYLSAEDEVVLQTIKEKFLKNMEIVCDENNILILTRYSSNYTSLIITFMTDGTLLSEGGRWVCDPNQYIEGDEMKVVAMGDDTYNFLLDSICCYCNLDISIEERGVDGIAYNMNGVVRDIRTEDKPDVINSGVVETLQYRLSDRYNGRFVDGVIGAVFNSFDATIRDEVRMEFMGDAEYLVTYRGYSGMLNQHSVF